MSMAFLTTVTSLLPNSRIATIVALTWRDCSSVVQRSDEKSLPKWRFEMLTIAWLAVLLGVIAIQWADGRFPFSASL
jgi:hypothetical protein